MLILPICRKKLLPLYFKFGYPTQADDLEDTMVE